MNVKIDLNIDEKPRLPLDCQLTHAVDADLKDRDRKVKDAAELRGLKREMNKTFRELYEQFLLAWENKLDLKNNSATIDS